MILELVLLKEREGRLKLIVLLRIVLIIHAIVLELLELLLIIVLKLLWLEELLGFSRLKCLLVFNFRFHIVFNSLFQTVLLAVHNLKLEQLLVDELL